MRKLIKLETDKNVIFNQNINEFISSDEIYIPIKSNYQLLVKIGEQVYKGQIILENNLNKVISPISGIVGNIDNKMVDGKLMRCLNIHNDYKERMKSLRHKEIKYTKDTLISKLYENYFKYIANTLETKKINNLIINGLDDEPYILNNSYIVNKYAKELLFMTDLLASTFSIDHPLIAIKNNQTNTIDKYINRIGTYPKINLAFIEDKYLLGNPFFLLEYLSLKESDSLVIDVKTLLNIYNAIKYNELTCNTFITISGPGAVRSQVLKVKIGATLKDIIQNNIKVRKGSVKYILNGLMTGYECNIENTIVTNQTLGIIIIPDIDDEELPCNNCGLCYRICPVKINPKKAMDYHQPSKNCLDCGLCSYACPCHINLRKFLKEQ